MSTSWDVAQFTHAQPPWLTEIYGPPTSTIFVVVGTIIVWLHGDLTSATDTGDATVCVLITSQVLYLTVWRPSGIAPRIEQHTSKA